MSDMACPVCGTEIDVTALFAHADDQRALARLAAVSIPLGARVLQYTTLFQPPKTRLTAAKKIKLLLQLLPDLERQAVEHKGRTWPAPLSAWAEAIDGMLAARVEARLELPLRGHGYLYAVLAGMANRVEARGEAQAEQARRTPARQDQVQVRGQSLPIGEALQVVYAGKDPELARIDADRARAAPMPEAVRARIAAIRNGQTDNPQGD